MRGLTPICGNSSSSCRAPTCEDDQPGAERPAVHGQTVAQAIRRCGAGVRTPIGAEGRPRRVCMRSALLAAVERRRSPRAAADVLHRLACRDTAVAAADRTYGCTLRPPMSIETRQVAFRTGSPRMRLMLFWGWHSTAGRSRPGSARISSRHARG
jgi:hypothetical protein